MDRNMGQRTFSAYSSRKVLDSPPRHSSVLLLKGAGKLQCGIKIVFWEFASIPSAVAIVIRQIAPPLFNVLRNNRIILRIQ